MGLPLPNRLSGVPSYRRRSERWTVQSRNTPPVSTPDPLYCTMLESVPRATVRNVQFSYTLSTHCAPVAPAR